MANGYEPVAVSRPRLVHVARPAQGRKVQQQSAATAPTETGLRATQVEPLTCVTDLQRPSCLQMVRRRSTVRFRNGAPAQIHDSKRIRIIREQWWGLTVPAESIDGSAKPLRWGDVRWAPGRFPRRNEAGFGPDPRREQAKGSIRAQHADVPGAGGEGDRTCMPLVALIRLR
jgi:hypothetical protein